jgi:hypothetical protein
MHAHDHDIPRYRIRRSLRARRVLHRQRRFACSAWPASNKRSRPSLALEAAQAFATATCLSYRTRTGARPPSIVRRCPHYLEDDRTTITARRYRDERDLGAMRRLLMSAGREAHRAGYLHVGDVVWRLWDTLIAYDLRRIVEACSPLVMLPARCRPTGSNL